jgi:hypothetical protein
VRLAAANIVRRRTLRWADDAAIYVIFGNAWLGS